MGQDMTNTPNSSMQQILHLLSKGLHALALDQAKSLKKTDPVSGRLALMRVYAEMNDFLGFSNCLENNPSDDIPDELVPFTIRSLIFTGQPEHANKLAQSLVQAECSPNRKLVVASLFEELGQEHQTEELLGQLAPALKTNPRFKILQAKLCMNRKDFQSACGILEDAKSSFPSGLGPVPARMTQGEIGFLLSRSYDKLGDYDSAWQAAADAHIAKPEPFDVERLENQAMKIRDFFTPERIMQMSQASDRPVEPLLVMGNPRSGTTLLDTILGMHPEVVSGGELSVGAQLENELTPLLDSYLSYPECLKELRIEDANSLAHLYSDAVSGLAQGRRFVTNKALNINLQLGLLRSITPGMRTISLHRHPLDNCVSCFMSLIPMSGHGYVQDQEKMSRVWIIRRMLQDHWAEVMSDQPILQLHYESMVHNQAFETRRILDFLNLDFDESCLRFHESATVAATVSSKQVQQPMYNTSAGRWQRYEKHLSILIDRLDPWLE